ncbi:MAG: inositol polyphosphate 5-phosphatase [Candelina submexicana]|nr:MAG: inositol polyphosphate 5-phosphatase [Candelina submexicana]
MSVRVLLRDYPHRAIALVTSTHALIFRHSPASTELRPNGSNTSIQSQNSSISARCMVEFSLLGSTDLSDYRSLSSLPIQGTLGLITISNDIFICLVSGASRVATVRPGETVQRIHAVEFRTYCKLDIDCLNRSEYDHVLNDDVNLYHTDSIAEDGFNHRHREPILEHPCLALKRLLSGGTFYYSVDFDLTSRLQDRSVDASTYATDNHDNGLLWNSYMIEPLIKFRSRLSLHERDELDSSRILTSAIRGFVQTIAVPSSASPIKAARFGLPATLTLISRLSCLRAGTRFNSRGIDDDGNVANFVETETVFWHPSGLCFSYAQIRGSVPVFWEQATNILPGQQKIQVTRSPEATQPAFDKHFERLEIDYGAIHILNLLSETKPGEVDLSARYRYHVAHSSLNKSIEKGVSSERQLLKETEYDFHAETKGPGGYEAASMIRRLIEDSADGFAYYMSEEIEEMPDLGKQNEDRVLHRSIVVLQQEGIFRTNCLDCLDRTNLIQTIISQMAIEIFLSHRGERAAADFWMRHSSLWADNGDSLSKIYAGTGALKTSFTRHGKMSLAGAFADFRKSATRAYVNNFEDKGRQNTMDMLLGRLVGQAPVHLYDPINDFVNSELSKRAHEYSSSRQISIWVGTFNLNGRTSGINSDLSAWLCPDVDASQQNPDIVAVGFQEIVELSPQQIMSTDPARRQLWETAVKRTLNENARKSGSEEYILLRSGQLVGAALSIFVRISVLGNIKNVEGSVKKTGMSGVAGNKGAVAIRMDYASTRLCFVTAHLAAGFANYEERNRDYRTINHGLRFQRNRSIEDHDTIIWLGDFNYRIGLGDEKVRNLIQKGDLDTLYQNDQLNLQMVAGLTFPFYSEARITFMPTYKFDNGTDEYDTSEKARIPAWCDRILRKGTNLRQITYQTANLRFSDHRPVFGTFHCVVSVVNESLKDTLSQEIYNRRRVDVGGSTANANTEDTDDEDLIGYDSISPGLPPASSDRRKWWLDNGLPARSNIKGPSNTQIPNPQRPSNPFVPTSEPDWVEKTGALPPVAHTAMQSPNRTGSRKQLPPPFGTLNTSVTSLPPNPKNVSNGQLDGASSFSPPSSSVSLPVSSSQHTLRKAGPPIPKKPALLRSPSSQSSNFTTDTKDTTAIRAPQRPTTVKVDFPPPPRRSGTMKSRQSLYDQGAPLATRPKTLQKPRPSSEDESPPLPPRRSKSAAQRQPDLLDERDDALDSMSAWRTLQPQ